MFPLRGFEPPCYRRLNKSELETITHLELDQAQIDRFLGPLSDLVATVRNGTAHSMIGIDAADRLVGFYVIHPDPRDRTCWWLGWLAIDRRWEGQGLGKAAVRAAIKQMRQVAACRRIRLLVAAENDRAIGIYHRAGFHAVGRSRLTGELILELSLALPFAAADLAKFLLAAVVARACRVLRHRRLRLNTGPHPAWVIGVERGPPGATIGFDYQYRQRPIHALA